jgi:hypothetical protein
VVEAAGGSAERRVLSGAEGEFAVCSLAPGRYKVTTRYAGATEERWVDVGAAGEALEIRIDAGSDADGAAEEPGERASGDVSATGEFHTGGASPALPDSPETVAPGKRGATLHGKAYGFLGSGLGSLPDVSLPEQFPLTAYGASVGGALGERTRYSFTFDAFGGDPGRLLATVAAAEARAGKALMPGGATLAELASASARVDHRFSDRDTGYAHFLNERARVDLVGRTPGGGLAGVNPRQLEQTIAGAGNSLTLSPNTVNETRAEMVVNEIQLPGGAQGVGVTSALPTVRRDRVFEAADNIYRQMGGQSLRFGGDFLLNQMAISFLESSLGRTGSSSFSQSDRAAEFHVDSSKQVRRNLLLTSGVAYNVVGMRGFKTDTNNLTPQAGFAWSPATGTVIRGGGSMYYDQAPLPAIAASATPGVATNLADSARFVTHGETAAGAMAVFSVYSPTMQRSYVETANLEVEQQLAGHVALTSQWQYARGLQMAIPVSHSTPMCLASFGCEGSRGFRGTEGQTGAQSSYTGFTVALTQEPVRWGQYKVAYTYASANGAGALGNLSSISDVERRVSLTSVLHTSAEPASTWRQYLSRGFVLSGTGDYTNRSEFVGMNFIDMNARLTKSLAWSTRYRLDFLAETFNTLERTNASFSKSLAEMGDRAASMFATYRSVASLQGPSGTRVGLRLGF